MKHSSPTLDSGGRCDTLPGKMSENDRAHPDRGSVDLSTADFEALFDAVSNWGRWGEDDQRGALNYLTPERVAGAAQLVSTGETITLSLPLNTRHALDNPEPADHWMTMLSDVDIGSGTLRFAKEYIGVDYHNDGHSHIDALCHVAFDGALYNGKPSASVTSAGAAVEAIEVLRDGLVGPGRSARRAAAPRGALARARRARLHRRPRGGRARAGGRGLRGRHPPRPHGHARRCAELEPWDTASAKAGLHPTTARFLAERRVAALGSDGNSDTAPSTTEGIDFPIHALALNAMGVHLLDYLQFEDLVVACEREGRWEFLFAGAPLRVVDGTGSPLNPTAIL